MTDGRSRNVIADDSQAVIAGETWRVVFWWRSAANLFESSCDAALPTGVTALEAILTVARWRDVDLSICHDVSARRLTPEP